MFTKLTQNGNAFNINKSIPFVPRPVTKDLIIEVFNFSYNMTFGKVGEHRGYRTGGQYSRKNGELFCNTFQGKLAEFTVYNELVKMGFNLDRPDLKAWGLGKWDETDLIINGKKLSIKSVAFFSNLLLLETKDWNNNGIYLPNNTSYDFTVLVRIKPDIKQIFRKNGIFHENEIAIDKLHNIVLIENYSYDIPGYITNIDLKNIIANGFILPQNSLLNGTTKMDASNYYIQSGELKKLSVITDQLK